MDSKEKSQIIRAIIIDDEQAALSTLSKKIQLYTPDIEVIALANSAKEGLQAIQNHKPNLVFLDIEMPWMNGFEMLECLGDHIDFDIVFVTAYDQYAIKAFKTKAMDYLLKPVDKDDLIECMNSLKVTQEKLTKSSLTELKELSGRPSSQDRLLINSTESIEVISKEDIVYCQADSNYSYIYTKDNRKIVVSKSLNTLEKQLDPKRFIRIHRSYIANLSYIRRFTTTDGYQVILKEGHQLPVSRRKKDLVLEALMNSSGSIV